MTLEDEFRKLGSAGPTATDLARIETAIPASAVAGTRYDKHQMKMLDSERGTGSFP